jgi:hypothetical protein
VRKEDSERLHTKRVCEIPLNMGQGNDAGHGGRGRTGGQGPVAVEVAAEVPRRPCLARHRNKEHAKTSKAMSSS